MRRVSRHRRTPANHLLVVVISAEDRIKKKPYAIPVQCIAYEGLRCEILPTGNAKERNECCWYVMQVDVQNLQH